MCGADVARAARSLPAAAVGRASVRAIRAATESCTGTPATIIAVGKTIDHEAARVQGLKSCGDSADFCRSTRGWREIESVVFERADATFA
jgi:hypothetical protein